MSAYAPHPLPPTAIKSEAGCKAKQGWLHAKSPNSCRRQLQSPPGLIYLTYLPGPFTWWPTRLHRDHFMPAIRVPSTLHVFPEENGADKLPHPLPVPV